MTPEKAAPVTGTTLRTTGPVPAGSRQGTSSVFIYVAQETRTDPMAVDGIKLDAVAESAKTESKHQIQLECGE